MTRTLYALTTDPERTWEIAALTPQRVWVESLYPRDAPPRGPVAGLIIDLDYLQLDHGGRARMVEQAPRWAARFPVAVLSFNLEEAQEEHLLWRGVIVSRRLEVALIDRLLGLPPGAAAAAVRPAA
jgi:hypothetical protein